MYCRFCGNELNEDSLYCNKCGNAVKSENSGIQNTQGIDGQNKSTNGENTRNVSVNIKFDGDLFNKNIKKYATVVVVIILCIFIGRIILKHFDRPSVEEIEAYIKEEIDPNSYVTWVDEYDFDGNHLEGESFFYDSVEITKRIKQKDGTYLVAYNAEIANTVHKLYLKDEIEYTKINDEWIPGDVLQDAVPILGPADDKVCEQKVLELFDESDNMFVQSSEVKSGMDYSFSILSMEESEKILPNKYIRGYKKGKIFENLGMRTPFEEDIVPQMIRIECECSEKSNYVKQNGKITIYAIWCVYYMDLKEGAWAIDPIMDDLLEEKPELIIADDYSMEWFLDGEYSCVVNNEKYVIEIKKIEEDTYQLTLIDAVGTIREITGECQWDNALKQAGSLWIDEDIELRITLDGMCIYTWNENDYGPYELVSESN